MPAGTELSETHSCFSVAESELEPELELELELELESEQDQIMPGWSKIFILNTIFLVMLTTAPHLSYLLLI